MNAPSVQSRNQERYHFKDFTLSGYRKLVQIAKKNFIFSDYHSFDKKAKFILWRHDVDFSLDYSLELAAIEKEEGVRSTFFLLLHSEYYNLLEAKNTQAVRSIVEMGHDIGVHFDTHYYNVNTEDKIEQALMLEKYFLQDIFKVEIRAFSFHNTTPFTMNCMNWSYGGLINTYAAYFQNEVSYCSDSNGIWRYDRLEDVLQNPNIERAQILTHPEWWQETIRSPKERICHIINKRADDCKNLYSDLLGSNGRENIDWE
jgi:hypothetical protein